jgi:uncharacterized membrane protein
MRWEAIDSLQKRSQQRGAAAVFAAIAMVALIAATALAIDVGRLYLAKQRLQGLADLAALDAARVVSRCNAQPIFERSDLEAAVRDSLQRNDAPSDVVGNAVTRMGAETVEPGGLRRFETTASPNEADAVRVRLSRPMPGRLVPFFGSDEGDTLLAYSAAHQPVEGAVWVGARVLDLDSADSPLLDPLLGGLLGASVNLSLLSYQALASTVVDLSVLAAEVGVESTDELLTLQLSGPAMLALLGDSVEDLGNGAAGTAASALYTLAELADGGRSMRLGDVLDMGPDRELPAEGAVLNTGQLLMAVAQALGSGIPVHLPLDLSIPGLASVQATVTISEPPRIAVGPIGLRTDGEPRTLARSAAVSIGLDVELLQLLGSLASIKLQVDVGQAEAWIEEVQCARAGSSVAEARPRGSGHLLSLHAPEQNLLNILGLVRIYLDGDSTASGGSSGETGLFSILGPFVPAIAPPPPADHQRQFGNPDLLANLSAELRDEVLSRVEVEILNTLPLPVNSVLSALLAVLDPLLSELDLLLAGLFQLLGVSVAGGDLGIESLDMQSPSVFDQQPASNDY